MSFLKISFTLQIKFSIGVPKERDQVKKVQENFQVAGDITPPSPNNN